MNDQSILKFVFAIPNNKQTITLFDNVLSINKNDTDAMYNKGNALDDLGKHQEAITWYDKVLVINKNDTDAMYAKGVALGELGKYQDALIWFDKVLIKTRSIGFDMDAISNKAYVLGINLKEYDKALSLAEEYLTKYPKHKGLLCTTAELYNQTGYEGVALHYKEQVTKVDPYYECGLIVKVGGIEKEAFA
jgi:tetratricopeptide (TPR) repeat protein